MRNRNKFDLGMRIVVIVNRHCRMIERNLFFSIIGLGESSIGATFLARNSQSKSNNFALKFALNWNFLLSHTRTRQACMSNLFERSLPFSYLL